MKKTVVAIALSAGLLLLVPFWPSAPVDSFQASGPAAPELPEQIPAPQLPKNHEDSAKSWTSSFVSIPKTMGGLPDELSITQKISDASASYDERAVQAIAPYLLNPNKEVRRIAVEALVRVGSISAASKLTEAAKGIHDPREASVFLNAADFLSLPSVSELATPLGEPAAANAGNAKRNR